jgi:hypothetical protein
MRGLIGYTHDQPIKQGGMIMGMRPIHRIPQLDNEGKTLASIVQGELGGMPPMAHPAISAELLAALHYSGPGNPEKQEEFLECFLDWAMQIRSELGIDWGMALKAASILYYG